MKLRELKMPAGDGAHCGLTDWYPEVEAVLVEALKRGGSWTTGWYASKKEIASACITLSRGWLTTEVTVSDDFDTGGYGQVEILGTKDLDRIRDAITQAWELAEDDQAEKRPCAGFTILHDGQWVETYVYSLSDLEKPPGDYYERWGWQGEVVVPEDVKSRLERWIQRYMRGEVPCPSFTCKGWSVRPWKEK